MNSSYYGNSRAAYKQRANSNKRDNLLKQLNLSSILIQNLLKSLFDKFRNIFVLIIIINYNR